ncbi:MAG: hypothetical protein ACOZF0_18095 [Thermodesulfobacteriota bacterium]
MKTVWMVLMVLSSVGSAGECADGVYGLPVAYSRDRTIRYPDFALRFEGIRHVVSPAYPRGFRCYDFEIRSSSRAEVHVTWSAGTGELGPVAFSIDAQAYFLELKANSLATDPGKQWLKDNELIIWKQETYLEKQEEFLRKRNNPTEK